MEEEAKKLEQATRPEEEGEEEEQSLRVVPSSAIEWKLEQLGWELGRTIAAMMMQEQERQGC